MRNEIDEVVELAKRHDCGEQEVFEKCLEIYKGHPNEEQACKDADHYLKTGFIPHYVRHYYRTLEPIPDDYTQRSIKIVASKIRPFVKSIKGWFDN